MKNCNRCGRPVQPQNMREGYGPTCYKKVFGKTGELKPVQQEFLSALLEIPNQSKISLLELGIIIGGNHANNK